MNGGNSAITRALIEMTTTTTIRARLTRLFPRPAVESRLASSLNAGRAPFFTYRQNVHPIRWRGAAYVTCSASPPVC